MSKLVHPYLIGDLDHGGTGLIFTEDEGKYFAEGDIVVNRDWQQLLILDGYRQEDFFETYVIYEVRRVMNDASPISKVMYEPSRLLPVMTQASSGYTTHHFDLSPKTKL